MKIRSLFREKKQTQISMSIINEMNKLSLKKDSKFVLLVLEKFSDSKFVDYKIFLKKKNITYIECSQR